MAGSHLNSLTRRTPALPMGEQCAYSGDMGWQGADYLIFFVISHLRQTNLSRYN